MIRNRQKGVSLIEVVVCLFLIGVLLAFYAAALNTVTLTRKLRYENYAYHIANKQMEALRNTSYGSLPVGGAIVDSMLTQIPSGAGNYTVSDYPGFSNVKEIVVTVTWIDGINKQVVLKTLAGQQGINP